MIHLNKNILLPATSICFGLFILFVFSSNVSQAEDTLASEDNTRYIVDRLYVSLRENADESSRAVARSLKSGTQLLLLEENDNGYSLVQTSEGVKGWIKNQYLQVEETAALQLPALQEKISELSQKSDAAILKELDNTRKENKKLSAENESLQKELDVIKHTSANVIRINEEHKEMIEKNQILQSDVDSLEAINEQLKSDQSTTSFIYGGLLVFGTIILMIIYDGIKRRRSYGSEW